MYEIMDGSFNNHHVVKIELDFPVDFDLLEDSIFDHANEAIELVELLLELRLLVAHVNDYYLLAYYKLFNLNSG